MATDWYRNGRKGAQGELLAAVDLMDRGYEVFRAVDPVASTDLIAHSKGQYWRIQVKAGSRELSPIQEGRQELVAWVDVAARRVVYEPGLPNIVRPMPKAEFDHLDTRASSAIERAVLANHQEGAVSWFVQARCQNDLGKYSCDVRTFEIHVKEFPDDPPPVRGPFVCPACGKPAKFEGVRTTRQWSDDQAREARWRVNRQLWEARAGQIDPQCLPVPLTFAQICDDKLAGWTDCESPLIEQEP